jgi:hypothetical protein
MPSHVVNTSVPYRNLAKLDVVPSCSMLSIFLPASHQLARARAIVSAFPSFQRVRLLSDNWNQELFAVVHLEAAAVAASLRAVDSQFSQVVKKGGGGLVRAPKFTN